MVPRVWVLLGDRPGDNAQLLCLAEALGWPFETKKLAFNIWQRIPSPMLGASRASLDLGASDPLEPPWPDLVIGCSRKAAPIARWIAACARASGTRPRTRLVHLQHTGGRLDAFDLIITTPQYTLPERSNVLHNSVPLNAIAPARLEAAAEHWRARLDHLPRPWTAVLVGGRNSTYAFDSAAIGGFRAGLIESAGRHGGSLLISTSARTQAPVVAMLAELSGMPKLLYRFNPEDPENPYLGYLALADRFIVTADSASMVAEACLTGRPVEIFMPSARLSREDVVKRSAWRGWRAGLIKWGLVRTPRDFDAYITALLERGHARRLGESAEAASASPLNDMSRSVARVKLLFEEAPPIGHAAENSQREQCEETERRRKWAT